MKQFFSDTVAADTIPLKLVVYLALLAAILILISQAWSTAVPTIDDAEIRSQIETASLSILSIQRGYARSAAERYNPEGTMCTLEFSLPVSVRYVSFGVDPDPDCNGNLSDSGWIQENNTIIYQYKNGVKNKVFLEGDPVYFVKGEGDYEGVWMPSVKQGYYYKPIFFEETAVVIESPVSGEFQFEMVLHNGTRYTMARF
jgi:hypothetical protein